MARPSGTTGIAQKQSSASHAQRTAASSKSRPGARKPTDTEEAERVEAVRIGRSLNGRVMRLIEQRISHAEQVELEVARELKQPRPDYEWVGYLRQLTPGVGEIATLAGQIWDRFGTPRRNSIEVSLENAPPIMLFAGDAPEAWRKREATHAAVANGSNGHADGNGSG
jgi:hypothetical protein